MGRPRKDLELTAINDAIKKTRSYMEAARYLKVSYNTFKAYCRKYEIWKQGGINPSGKGIPRISRKKKKSYKETLKGKFNGRTDVNPTRLKDYIITELLKEEKCEVCGFDEKRITDERAPILIGYKDGNKTNYKIENLMFLCYNHAFLIQGNIVGRTKEYIYDSYSGEIIDRIDFK